MTIHEQLKATGCELDSHESDLYAPVTPATTAIVDAYKFKDNVRVFESLLGDGRWFDIPFANDAIWEGIGNARS